MTAPRFLLLPGWQNSDPDHWQSHWERRFGLLRVQQDDWWWPRRGDWMMRLEETLLADERPAVLIAHSLGCLLVAAWAAHSQHTHRVGAALLVAPPDAARADMPPQVQAWAPVPARPLPFPSTAVLSADDPYCSASAGLQMAAAWGSEIGSAGAGGHLNSASGLGDWPDGQAWLQALLPRAGWPASAWPPPAGPAAGAPAN